ncbi:MAG: prolipoprotein diacylglyceryl transferase [Candidatus Cloacimonadota bacterium]|nr:MAG: prolipoprotein diacylglyceryl transferase [Candidatus Cloacimonadota bacterium]
MYPILIEIWGIPIYTYGVCLATAFFLAVKLLVRRGAEVSLEEEIIYDLAIISIFSAIVGARIAYVYLAWDHYSQNLFEIIQIYRGGLVFFGGLMGGIAGGVSFWTYKKQDVLQMGDMIAISLSLGQGIGRIGCFFYGCCYGMIIQKDSIWASFGVHFPLHMHDLRHPTQLYSAVANVLISLFLYYIYKKGKLRGRVVIAYFYVYGTFRFLIEIIRDDVRGTILGITSLTTSQTVSILGILFGIGLQMFLTAKSKKLAQE